MISSDGYQGTEQNQPVIEGLGDAYAAVARGLAAGLTPPPPIDFNAWARENIVFGNESEFEGSYDPDKFPFFKEVLDCLLPSHPAREVVLKKSAQIGGTVLAQVFFGACIDLDPGPFLYVHPTLENGKRWARTKLKPFIRSSKRLRRIFPEEKSRDAANSIFFRERADERGHLQISGANSAASLSMMSFPRQVQDDLSKWETNEGGDPETQADSRSEGFLYAKIFKVGTPLIKGACRISKAYDRSDKRRYHVPCPHCQHMHPLEWENFVKSIYEGMDPAKAHFTCPACGGVIESHHRADMVKRGTWIAENPSSNVPGFSIWAAYSPLTTLARLAQAWLNAMGDAAAEQSFMNDRVGEEYEARGEAPPWKTIRDRANGEGLATEDRARTIYPKGTIPANAILICAGVDCQGDRLEWHVKGFGPDLRRYTIDYGVIDGHISEDRTRNLLDALLKRRWKNTHGRYLGIDMLAIDANYDTQDALDWAKKHPDNKVIAVRGANAEHAPPLVAVKYERIKGVRIKKYQKKFFNVGVSPMKASLFRHLEKIDPQVRGYCGYPEGLEDEFFKQLCSERRVLTKLKNNFHVVQWKKLPDTRNEVLDTEMYAEAAARRLGWTELSDQQWQRLRAERESAPTETQSDMFDPNLARQSARDEVKPIEPVAVPDEDGEASKPAQPQKPKSGNLSSRMA